jgi:hypothetical protein
VSTPPIFKSDSKLQTQQRAFPIVDEQLQRAGVRMAALFSALLG